MITAKQLYNLLYEYLDYDSRELKDDLGDMYFSGGDVNFYKMAEELNLLIEGKND